jgi:hypothetical protein
MFSASLLTMIIHSLPPAALAAFQGPREPTAPSSGGVAPAESVPDASDMARRFTRALGSPPDEWPRIPVVARAHPEHFDKFAKAMPSDAPRDESRGFLWGRIPLDVLISHYIAAGTMHLDREHLDLGTPIFAFGGGGGSGTVCATLLARTLAPQSATVGAALVDLGVPHPGGVPGTPSTYNNKLRHVAYPPAASVDLSSHAEDVLAALLERLDSINAPGGVNLRMLDITTVSMALVCNPTADQVRGTLGCFDQHCAPEMLTAVQDINTLLDGDKLPAVVNMSLGTHVGPHNGSSPLEAYVAGSVFKPSDRFLFASAGNEGGKGISLRLELKKGEADYMELLADEACTELLVEFWWDDSGPAGIEIATLTSGPGLVQTPIAISPKVAVATFSPPPIGPRPNMSFFTLLHAPSHANMACIAFAISRTSAGSARTLPELRVSFDITAKSADATVHAWVVLCDKSRTTHFTQGGPDGTIAAPASDPRAMSVAGYHQTLGQMWRYSSRGPASQYVAATQSPVMAHLSHPPPSSASSEHGTSYASPRAAADATKTLADSAKRVNATDGEKLLQETYGPTVAWNSRYGFHQQTT